MVTVRAISRLGCALGAITVASCALVLVPASAVTIHETNGCVPNVQNPHDSQSHGGIDVTATFYCDSVPTQIDLLSPGGLALWNCPTNRQQNHDYRKCR